MTVVIAVRFKTSGKSYYFDPLDFEIYKGGSVIVETTRGVEIGEVTMERTEVEDTDIVAPLKKVLRIATEEDIEHARENREKEKWALGVCQDKIAQHNLEMKLIDVEYTFDNNKILFYFTSDGRVDFRELVKDLAAVFKTRIELRQIGVRDEAKILGGIGVCGRCLCCKSFLGDFHPVSIKMAKEQGLSLNPTKISGSCGRLMCCLKYEQDAYEYLLSKTPSIGAIVDTDKGRGVVASVSLLKGLLKVRLDDGNESALVDFTVEEVRLIRNSSKRSRDKNDSAAIPAAGLDSGEIRDDEILDVDAAALILEDELGGAEFPITDY
jgi:cell fate regulator YaaT (PSP1 superfamily)